MISLVPKRVDWLVASTVLAAVALVWTTLVALDAFSAFVRELDEIGSGNYSLGGVFSYVALTIPRRAYTMFATAAVIGGVLGLGALAPTAELTAMRAGGLSKLRICLAAAMGVGLFTVLVVSMGETLAPWGELRAQALVAGAKSKDRIAAGSTGLWAREGESLINASSGRVTPAGVELLEPRIYEFTPDGQLLRITLAERAEHTRGRWLLFGVTRMRFEAESVASSSVSELEWKSTLDPRLLRLSVIRPDNLSARDLDANIRYLKRNRLDATPYEAAYWSKVFYPLNVMTLLFCALPFAFGALRSGGLPKRLFLGVVLAVGWFLLQRTVVNIAQVYGVDFRLAHGLPALLLIAASYAYFRRSS